MRRASGKLGRGSVWRYKIPVRSRRQIRSLARPPETLRGPAGAYVEVGCHLPSPISPKRAGESGGGSGGICRSGTQRHAFHALNLAMRYPGKRAEITAISHAGMGGGFKGENPSSKQSKRNLGYTQIKRRKNLLFSIDYTSLIPTMLETEV